MSQAAAANDIWQLLQESGLMTHEQAQYYYQEFQQQHPGSNSKKELAIWLIKANLVSRFQMKVLLSGQTGPFDFHGYRLYDKLEEGALADTYRAVHLQTGHVVGLQFLDGDVSNDSGQVQEIERKVRLLSNLRTDHLSRCYHFLDLEAYKLIAFENLEGQTLADALEEHGPYSMTEASHWVWQIAKGLDEMLPVAGASGEIRPETIWIDDQGNAKLMLFPLDRAPGEPLVRTTPKEILEAHPDQIPYMAPETIRGKADDARSDLYSLGCVFYELLTGEPPFGWEPLQEVAKQHVKQKPTLAHEKHGDVPPAISQLIDYLLAKDPSQRYQEPEHFAEALVPYMQASMLHAPPQAPTEASMAYDEWIAVSYPPLTPGTLETGMFPPSPTADEPAFAPAAPANNGGVQLTNAPAGTSGGSSFVSEDEEFQRRRQEQIKKKKQGQLYSAIGAGVVLFLIAGYFLFGTGSSPEPTDPTQVAENDSTPETTQTSDSTSTETAEPKETGPEIEQVALYEEIFEPEKPQWESPTRGTPLDLTYLPNGVQLILAVRPAEIMAEPEAELTWRALGPFGMVARSYLEAYSGTALENIDQALIGLMPNGAMPPSISLVIKTIAPVPNSVLLASWGNPEPTEIGSNPAYQANGKVFFLPPGKAGKVIAITPQTYASDLEMGAPPLLRKELEQLLETTDSKRQFTMLFAPNFPFSSGKALFSGPMTKIKDSFDRLMRLPNNQFAQAGLISLHVDEMGFYTEIRMHGGSAIQPNELADYLRESLVDLPNELLMFYDPPEGSDAAKVRTIPTKFTQPIVGRYPRMLFAWTAYLRSGTAGRHVKLSSLLPGKAAHNLVLASQLALRDPGIVVQTQPVEVDPMEQWKSRSLVERLEGMPYKLVIGRDSLDRVMAQISEDTEIPIRLEGGDLQLEGITQNQSFGLEMEEPKPLGEVITEIMMRCNPDKTTTAPSQDTQKLVFAVAPDQKTIVITTRGKAKERGTPWPVFDVQ
ncbi:Hypothetical protein PBC10988_24830 [Planctomycetales bacterium 10988]|nr:Hypothetical protein PBC10988_24830 [Planctomycetales bacterium 10988]